MYNEEKQRRKRDLGKKGVPHRKFSKEDKLKIIREHLDGHEAIETLEKKYKIGHGTIANWIRIYLEDGEDALTPHKGNPYAALHTSKNLSEEDRLRLIIAKQEVEIARLKKGYYVEGVGADKVFVTGKDSNMK